MIGPLDRNGFNNSLPRTQPARRAIGVIVLLLLAALAATPAVSQLADCNSDSAERVVTGCTRVIDDPRESAASRVIAHERRGYVHLMRRELEKAIDDFSAALRDDTGRAFSLYGRGMARIFSGDAAGQNEMETAIMMRPAIAEEFKKFGVK